MQSHGDGGIRWSYERWHHRSGRERSGWTGTSWGTTAAARRRRCDGDNGHLKRLVQLSHEERKQQQQQSTHSHTPDLAFILAFTVLVFTTFVISIALVDCCVVRSRHANCWAVRRGKSSPTPPPPPAPPPPLSSSSSSRLDLFSSQFRQSRSICRHAGSADSGARPADSQSGCKCPPPAAASASSKSSYSSPEDGGRRQKPFDSHLIVA